MSLLRVPRRPGALVAVALAVVAGVPLLAMAAMSLAAGADVQAWRRMIDDPQWPKALTLSIGTGLVSTVLSVVLAAWILSRAFATLRWQALMRTLAPMLAVPHVAFAIGLVLLLAPSGWVLRAFSPWATGLEVPPPWATVQDPWGFGLVLALVGKEVPFLLWTAASQLQRGDTGARWARELAVAQTLGYTRAAAWWRVVWPQLAPRLTAPILAVGAYGLTVVDVALVIGPTSPPTAAVLAWQWLQDTDVAVSAQGAAAAWMLAVAGAAVAGPAWWLHLQWVRRASRGDGLRGDGRRGACLADRPGLDRSTGFAAGRPRAPGTPGASPSRVFRASSQLAARVTGRAAHASHEGHGEWPGRGRALAELRQLHLARLTRGLSRAVARYALPAGYLAVLAALAVASVAGVWPFPAFWPERWSLAGWQAVVESADTIGFTATLALTSALAALVWAVLWLETAPARWDAWMRPLAYLPLLLPALLWVVGLHRLALWGEVDGTVTGLWVAHTLAVLPYTLIALSPAYLGFDARYRDLVQTLGHGRIAFLLRVKWPLLRAGLASAVAVGFAVSVAQYLPTQFIGAGRYPTITTEAVSLSSGGQRALLGAYAWLQWLLPVGVFGLAAWCGRPRRFAASWAQRRGAGA